MTRNLFFQQIHPDGSGTFGVLNKHTECSVFSVFDAQISGIFIFPEGAALPTDWSDLASWKNAIDNEDTTQTKGKYFECEGSVSESGNNAVQVGRGYQYIHTRTFVLSATIKNSDTNHRNLIASFQNNPVEYTFFFETIEGWIYGSEDGIIPFFADSAMIWNEGAGDIETGNISIVWKARQIPDRRLICFDIPKLRLAENILVDDKEEGLTDDKGNLFGL